MTYVFRRFIPAAAAVFCAWLFLSFFSAYAAGGDVIRVSVEQVDILDSGNLELKAKITNTPNRIPLEQGVTLKVKFITGSNGSIDWTNADNRSRAMALGLEPGDILEAEVTKDKDIFHVRRLKYVEAGKETYFFGREKIRPFSMLEALDGPKSRLQVVVSLACPADSFTRTACAKRCKKSQTKVKCLQEKVLAFLSGREFKVENRMENVPIISGRVTMKGLKILAAHPLVVSIEEDCPQQLHQQSIEGFK